MKRTIISSLIISLTFLALPSAHAGLGDAIVSKDPVTGESVLNTFTLQQENKLGNKFIDRKLQRLRNNGVKVDHDQNVLERVRTIARRIVKVSHLPDVPDWEVHISDKDEWNAWAMAGGKIMVHEGLYSSVTDTKLAAVLAHEVAHVTSRHVTEDIAHKKIVGTFDGDVGSEFYQSTFSTNQEDEADRIGALYMALAGYNPEAAHELWYQQYKNQGNSKGLFISTHPVNKQRAENTDQYADKVLEYYQGPGKINPNYESVLKNNELISYEANSDPSLVEAGMDAWIQNFAASELAEKRKRKHRIAEKYYRNAMSKLKRNLGATVRKIRRARQVIKEKRLKVNEVGISKQRQTGRTVLHGRVQNHSRGANLKNLKVKFYYVKTKLLGENEVLGTQTGKLDSLPANRQKWLTLQPRQNVFNYDEIVGQVVDFEWPKFQQFAKKLQKYKLFYQKQAMRVAEKKAEEEVQPDDFGDAVASELKSEFLKGIMD